MTAPRPSFIRLATGITAEPSTTWTLTGIRRMVSKFPPGSAGAAPGVAAPGRPPAPMPLMSAGANVLVPPAVALSLWLISELCPLSCQSSLAHDGLLVFAPAQPSVSPCRRGYARRPGPFAPTRLDLLDQRTPRFDARLQPFGDLQPIITNPLKRPLEGFEHPVRLCH